MWFYIELHDKAALEIKSVKKFILLYCRLLKTQQGSIECREIFRKIVEKQSREDNRIQKLP